MDIEQISDESLNYLLAEGRSSSVKELVAKEYLRRNGDSIESLEALKKKVFYCNELKVFLHECVTRLNLQHNKEHHSSYLDRDLSFSLKQELVLRMTAQVHSVKELQDVIHFQQWIDLFWGLSEEQTLELFMPIYNRLSSNGKALSKELLVKWLSEIVTDRETGDVWLGSQNDIISSAGLLVAMNLAPTNFVQRVEYMQMHRTHHRVVVALAQSLVTYPECTDLFCLAMVTQFQYRDDTHVSIFFERLLDLASSDDIEFVRELGLKSCGPIYQKTLLHFVRTAEYATLNQEHLYNLLFMPSLEEEYAEKLSRHFLESCLPSESRINELLKNCPNQVVRQIIFDRLADGAFGGLKLSHLNSLSNDERLLTALLEHLLNKADLDSAALGVILHNARTPEVRQSALERLASVEQVSIDWLQRSVLSEMKLASAEVERLMPLIHRSINACSNKASLVDLLVVESIAKVAFQQLMQTAKNDVDLLRSIVGKRNAPSKYRLQALSSLNDVCALSYGYLIRLIGEKDEIDEAATKLLQTPEYQFVHSLMCAVE
ncbi:MAG: hypothetical protein KC582_01185 [Candidatus Magasanikbacteria bacterium]|nr:hypothetical protein [Candidatus Magasanikbacteria bacterium]